jgi:DNA modification methylase
MLDPTVGSGTSLLAAHNLRAQKIVGLEINPDIYHNAYNHIRVRATSTVSL